MSHGTPHTRACFYVIADEARSSDHTNEPRDATHVRQMYVEELAPNKVTQPWPIVFWHGMCQTGTGWITTHDGRPGWASDFLNHGYLVYVVDSPERGRSAAGGSKDLVTVDAEYVQNSWTATASNGRRWPQAHLHTQWPGTGQVGDVVFEQFMASQVPGRSNYHSVELLARNLGAALFKRIGPAILCTHSQSGAQGWVIADAVPNLVKGVIALEPLGPPFVNVFPSTVQKKVSNKICRPFGVSVSELEFDPPLIDPAQLKTVTTKPDSDDLCPVILQEDPPRKLINLVDIPVLIVTSESGYHATYDHATVAFMQQAGIDVTWLDLAKAEIRGNGHFMFLERNSSLISEKVHDWILANVSSK